MRLNDFNLSEDGALAASLLVDYHDQPTTSRAMRLELQARLRDIFDAPTTVSLGRARTVRKWCVALGIYERPKRSYEQPGYLFKEGRPLAKWPAREHT